MTRNDASLPLPSPDGRDTPAEERLSCATHGVGAALAAVGAGTLVTLAALRGEARHVATVAIFGASLVVVYAASAVYHACRGDVARRRLRIVDHAAIYGLIAGTYTPFLVVLVRGAWGWGLLIALWTLAAAGVVFKLLCCGRYNVLSSLLYIAMGWIGLIGAGPMLAGLPGGAVAWIVAGGVAYTAGVAFYLWDRLPFNHAVWHLFVLAGSACHFLAVLLYVVP